MSNSTVSETVTLIIPTLRRPEHLEKCLRSLIPQTHQASEVLVGIREDDHSNDDVLREVQDKLPVRAVAAKGIGVVGSMNSCLQAASGDYIGLLDDDIELPPEWIEKMVSHIRSDRRVFAAGGRDLLQDDPEMRRNEPLTEDVGRFHWFGRITGNHHCGGGVARKVDILRGSNFMLRGDFLRQARFDTELRGTGAQVNWELALALQAKQKGAHFIFDPDVQFIHHVGPRFDTDTTHRGGFHAPSISDISYNETLVILKHGRGMLRVIGFAWQVLVGTTACPGAVVFVRQLLTGRPHAFARLMASFQGRWDALKHCTSRGR